MRYVNVSCVLLFNALSCTDDPVPPLGAVPDRHQWDAGAAEPREAVIRLQRLPEPLPGDGRGPQRLCQGAAAGRSNPDKHTHVHIIVMHFQAPHTRSGVYGQHEYIPALAPAVSSTAAERVATSCMCSALPLEVNYTLLQPTKESLNMNLAGWMCSAWGCQMIHFLIAIKL